ncbi:MAG: PQQ-binding-like beta-propeller repeat protein [Anaerolineae bacterium]
MRLYKGALLVLALTLLTGCLGGGGDRQTLLSGGSWPGMTVHNEILYVANRGQVHAVDDQGRQLWSFPESPSNNQNFFAAPAVEEGLLVITDYSNAIFALDPERGTELWSFMTNNARFIGGATIGED